MTQFHNVVRCLILTGAGLAVAAAGALQGSSEPARGCHITYVKSDRKWRLGFQNRPYNKTSEYFEKQLGLALKEKGFTSLPAQENGSLEIALELLEVSTHSAVIKKPGMDVSATVTIRNEAHRTLFVKGYRGESRTLMNTYGHLIDHAIEDLTRHVVADGELVQILAGQKPTDWAN